MLKKLKRIKFTFIDYGFSTDIMIRMNKLGIWLQFKKYGASLTVAKS